MDINSTVAKAVIEAKRTGMRVDPDGSMIGKRGNVLASSIGATKYPRFSVYLEGFRVTAEVHKLQAYQKFGDLVFQEGKEIRHLNGNPADNSWDNIALGTYQENMMDKTKMTRMDAAKKAAAARRRYSIDDIRDIRRKKANGLSLKKIALEYKSSKGHISDIVNRKIYPED